MVDRGDWDGYGVLMYTKLYPSGARIQYNDEGHYHREDGPAIIAWWRGGKMCLDHGIVYKAWYLNGLFHREDGPVREWDDEIGNEYWLFGEMVSAEKFGSEFVLAEKMARIVEK